MLRKILLASIVGIGAYVIGVRSGFKAAVRDYFENDAQLIEKVAADSDNFDYGEATTPSDVKDIVRDATEASDSHQRTYQ